MASDAWYQEKWSQLEAVGKEDSREETKNIKITYKRELPWNAALEISGIGLYKGICALDSRIKITEAYFR